MIRIRTPSRLHFGLFSLPSTNAGTWLNCEGEPTLPYRSFGGVGLMIDKPGIELTVEVANRWSIDGPLAARAQEFINDYCVASGFESCLKLTIESAAPEHVGLGTGTQLGLAIVTAMDELIREGLPPDILARFIGRGRRSAIGVYGFESGGFLVEGGKTPDRDIAPLLVRHDFPEDWRILLITPHRLQGTHGQPEVEAFAAMTHHERNDRTTESLCRLALLGMLPALVHADLQTFGEAVYDFNRRVGELFRPIQGGVYAHPRVEELIKKLRGAGIKGVGQSSWGPTVFALVAEGAARELNGWLAREQDINVLITSANNTGAVLSS